MILQDRFRERVVAILKERGWSQRELARQMGVDSPYVNQYMTGKHSPGLDVIERFASALGIDAGDLLASRELVS